MKMRRVTALRMAGRLDVVLAAVYGFGLVVATGLVSEWGRWYSPSPHHRAQVDALLQGRLALSDHPSALRLDLAWAEGGVQQVWGLGVPVWRLPFEAVSRLAGKAGFPDLLAFALALGMTAWFVLNALRAVYTPHTTAEATLPGPVRDWRIAGGALLLLLFAPFVNLLRSRFDIYEEVVAYEYLWGLILIAALLNLVCRPTPGRYWVLCGLAGLGGLVRPTLVLHGIGALGAATLFMFAMENRRQDDRGLRRRLKILAIGGGLFLLGCALLYLTNLIRFGAGFEFGHRLNLQFLYGSLYATRFDHPFAHEPVFSAARELFGLLFLTQDFSGGDFYREGIFPGQAAAARWREVYLSSYDLSYAALLLCGWGTSAWCGWRWYRRQRRPSLAMSARLTRMEKASAVVGLYSLVSSLLLLSFFLRNSVISSRYMLDLMPAFVAALLAGWLGWSSLLLRGRRGLLLQALSVATMAVWIGWQVAHGASAYGPPRTVTWEETRAPRTAKPVPVNFPGSGRYSAASRPAQTWIPYNGAGWRLPVGDIKPCVILFAEDPEFLELELVTPDPTRNPGGPRDFRAKIGLELLERESVRRNADGWTLRFRGPQNERYRRGIQPVFLATVAPDQLAEMTTPWRLVGVRWHEDPNAAGD
jgi:hypothetical protein